MDTVRAGKPLIELIELCFRAKRSLILVGHHGVGKSVLLEDAAGGLGIKFISRDLSLMEAPDLIGLPTIKGQTTIYRPPSFLPQGGSGILVFEELNRADRSVRAPCLQLLTARTLNDYQLPPGWLLAAAINPGDGVYEVAELDPAILSRFTQVEVIPDRDEWLIWAALHKVHPDVVAYVREDPQVFEEPESNPRSWTYVSGILWAADECATAGDTLRAAVIGQVGDARGSAFLAWRKRPDRPFAAVDILEQYKRSRAQVLKWVGAGHLELVQATQSNVLRSLQPAHEYARIRVHRGMWSNLAVFLSDIPPDLASKARAFFKERGYEVPPEVRPPHV